MGIIFLTVIFVLAIFIGLASADEGENSNSREPNSLNGFIRKIDHNINNRNRTHSVFELSESYYDKDGNEHEIDDNEYCEECDDFHE